MSEHTKDSLMKARDKAALVKIADEDFGVEIDPEGFTKEEIVTEILKLQAEDTLLDMDDDDESGLSPEELEAAKKAEAEANARNKDLQGRKDKQFKLVIHKQDGPGGKDDVNVSVNGYAWNIKRDQEVIVPQRVISVLKDAVMTEIEADGKGEWIENHVRRFSMTIEEITE